MTPEPVLYHSKLGLSHVAVRVFGVLHRHADKDATAFPSRSRIAKYVGCSISTLDRALKDLEAAGVVTVTRRKRPDGSWTSNLYLLHMTPPSVTHAARGGRTSDATLAAPVTTHESEPLNQSQRNQNGRDLIFEAVCFVCGIDWTDGIPKTQRGRVNAAVKELKAIDATPEDIVRKGVAYRDAYTTPLTPQALVGNWNVVDAAAMSEEQRAMARRELATMTEPTGRNLEA
jgi:hypothetical protein